MSDRLPTGIVTFLFTDIEGSTRLVREIGERYGDVLADQRTILRDVWARWRGVERGTEGDSFFVVFPSPADAVAAAAEAQQRLREHEWPHGEPLRVRMGMHTGEPSVVDQDYFGIDVNTAARIAGSGHGGQVLLSRTTRDLVASVPHGVVITDLGEHRLKDLDEPVAIFQLGSERFPPLKTISNTNLPRPASSFVGREREIAEVQALVREGARVVTLTGPGGSGKTRLAIESAAELVPEFKAGVFWVPLAPLRDPALVLNSIAQTIGANDDLAAFIGAREMLLLIDNLEQVIEAAPHLSTVARACPNLHMLATSRELLRIDGETEYPVQPLAEPEAVALFCARSRLDPDGVVGELCRRLDDLPLAVELAAARTKVLSPAEILDRLSARLDVLKGGRDAEPRQATLRATIEWSYDLLSSEEQTLFARLSAFAGGCEVGAAEDVAGADLDTLQALVDKSLVRRTAGRFWMLETIREFSTERLMDSGEAEDLSARHAGHYLALAEEAERHLFSERASEWHERLERELENVRSALEWFDAASDQQSVLRLAGALAEFWGVKGHLTEGRRRLEAALAADPSPTPARAKALNGAADLATGTGDNATAMRRAEEGLALNRELGDVSRTADSLLLLGISCAEGGDFVRARELMEESYLLYGNLDDEHNRLEATRLLGWAYSELGDKDRARGLLEECVHGARARGDRLIEGRSLDQLAGYALDEGRVEDAMRMLGDAFRANSESGDVFWTPRILCRFAIALSAGARPRAAARILSSGEALLEELASKEGWLTRMNEETIRMIRAQMDDDAFAEAWQEGRKLTAEGAVALALGEISGSPTP